MESQVPSIRRWFVWVLVWIIILGLLAGLFLWQVPLKAASDSPLPGPTLGATAIATGTTINRLGSTFPLYFPLIFNQGTLQSNEPN